jgi:DNA helicase II / ATP-dependent DNA helicase PcrA
MSPETLISKTKHLQGLNEAQKEAVLTIEGPLLVLAGAGAGKTRVIAHRILEIVKRGVPAQNILAITFTNKSAGEMRERVFKILRSEKIFGAPFVSTFHSLGLLIIKENAMLLGFKRTPIIYDRADSLREIKAALKKYDEEEGMEPRTALARISGQKGKGLSVEEFAQEAVTHQDTALALVWREYARTLAAQGAVDFDDLLLLPTRLLHKHHAIREKYQTRWRYIHIDEYQDTNHVQGQLVGLLVGAERNVCVVGDVDQTIYGWRGARIENIIQFEHTYPGAKRVDLEENYRSTQNIVTAANDVIKKNNNRFEKNSFTKNSEGELLSLYGALDESDEATFVVRTVKEKLQQEGKQPRDFAVLYRANFQSRALEEAFLRGDVSYQVVGTRFFERKEVKDVLAFIRASLYESAPDFERIANVPPRGLGKVTLQKIHDGLEHELKGMTKEKIAHVRALLARIKVAAGKCVPSELVRFVIVESGLERLFKEDKIEGAERLENLRELASLAARYDSLESVHSGGEERLEGLEAFLESAALQSDQDELKDDTNAVRLMTVHAAKGLEFDTVFIVGLEEGLFPYERAEETVEETVKSVEEERRLCYVAITRAQKKLYLSYASNRTIFGSRDSRSPSSFLGDIPPYLLEEFSAGFLGTTIYLD